MRAGQTLIAPDGYEVCLFPLEYMYISQDEGGSPTHVGTLCMDLLGWGVNGRIYQCNYYAPCTCKLVNSTLDPTSNMRVWESVNKVHLPDGSLDYICFQFGHDDNPPYSTVGTIVNQGDLIGHTGTTGYVTGDHVHYNVARGQFAGGEHVPPDNQYQLKNSIHIYDANYVNDTTIIEGYNHNWQIYQGGQPLPPYNAGDFIIMFDNISRTKRKEVEYGRIN